VTFGAVVQPDHGRLVPADATNPADHDE